MTTGYGALFPEGYQLSTTTPGHPWVCPIRSCGKAFAQIMRLGGHFVVSPVIMIFQSSVKL